MELQCPNKACGESLSIKGLSPLPGAMMFICTGCGTTWHLKQEI